MKLRWIAGIGIAALVAAPIATAQPQSNWAPAGRAPLSDAAAAKLVQPRIEFWSINQAANNYVPTTAQLNSFHKLAAKGPRPNRYYALVTGRDGLKNPTTDELVEWAAIKWGIPTIDLQAIVYDESRGRQNDLGDYEPVSKAAYFATPVYARGTYPHVYESLGISQIKWVAYNNLHNPGTDPLRWQSTAFALDYLGATVRYYYDGLCNWCGRGYTKGQQWGSIGAWNEPKPWGNPKAQAYIGRIKSYLNKGISDEPPQ